MKARKLMPHASLFDQTGKSFESMGIVVDAFFHTIVKVVVIL